MLVSESNRIRGTLYFLVVSLLLSLVTSALADVQFSDRKQGIAMDISVIKAIAKEDLAAAAVLTMFNERNWVPSLNLLKGVSSTPLLFNIMDIEKMFSGEFHPLADLSMFGRLMKTGARLETSWRWVNDTDTHIVIEFQTNAIQSKPEEIPAHYINTITYVKVSKRTHELLSFEQRSREEVTKKDHVLAEVDTSLLASQYFSATLRGDISEVVSLWHPDFITRIGDIGDALAHANRSFGDEAMHRELLQEIQIGKPVRFEASGSDTASHVIVFPVNTVVRGFPSDLEFTSILAVAPIEDSMKYAVFDSACWTVSSLEKVFPGLLVPGHLSSITDDFEVEHTIVASTIADQ